MSDTPQGPGWWQASDGKFYPPQSPTQPPPPPAGPVGPMGPMGGPMPPPAQSGMNGCLKAFLIGGAIALVLGFGGCAVALFVLEDKADEIADDLDFDDEDELRDLGQPDCRVNDAGFMEAELTVTNTSSERSNYVVIEVTFEDEDGALLATSALLGPSAVEPGQSAVHIASTDIEPPPNDSFDCRVTGVQRFSDELGDG